MNTKIEKVILQNLANDDIFMRKVIPFLKRDYFIDNNEKIVYDKIKSPKKYIQSLSNYKDIVAVKVDGEPFNF